MTHFQNRTDPATGWFLELLRSGLGGETPHLAPPYPQPKDWEHIYRLARQQAVTALVWDGVQRLPQQLMPPQELGRRFLFDSLRTEQANQRLNVLLPTLQADLARLDVPAALLKGQGYAALYPNPLHRQPGDIDIFTGHGWRTAQEGLPACYVRDKATAYFHSKLMHKGVVIENHRFTAELAYPPYQRWLLHLTDAWFLRGMVKRDVAGCPVHVAPPWYELVFSVVHFAKHLIGSGIGVRQLCDWVVLLRQHSAGIDPDLLRDGLRRLGLLRLAGAMTQAAIAWLGLEGNTDTTQALVYNDRRERRAARRIMDDMLCGGNFGHNERIHRSEGTARETLDLLFYRGRRMVRFADLWPREALCLPPRRLARYVHRKCARRR